MKNLATRNIKRFSRSKKKNDIKAHGDKNFIMGSQFAVGLPNAIFDLISEGTAHFRKQMIISLFAEFTIESNQPHETWQNDRQSNKTLFAIYGIFQDYINEIVAISERLVRGHLHH
jgi:hypothetical protein